MSSVMQQTDEGNHTPADTQEYLLICDLPQRIHSLRFADIEVPSGNDLIFQEISDGLTTHVSKALPEVRVRVLNMQKFSDSILAKANSVVSQLEHGFIVSSCTEIANPAHGMTLEVNRIIDFDGNILGIGARPGHPDLDTQINGVLATAAGRPIVLMEDGAFTGGTLVDIAHRLRARGATIAAAVIGFAFPQSLGKLYGVFEENQIHIIEPLKNPLDWVPDHDFFPFVPNCGRVVGIQFNGEPMPFYTHDGASYAVPYLPPYGPMAEWAGIPIEGPDICHFADFCVSSMIELFSRIDVMNGRKIKFEDIQRVKPRSSIPFTMGQRKLPHLNNFSIVEYLRSLRVEIW